MSVCVSALTCLPTAAQSILSDLAPSYLCLMELEQEMALSVMGRGGFSLHVSPLN